MKAIHSSLAASVFAVGVLLGGPAAAEIKIGLLGGITGPVASFVPAMNAASELAIRQINEQGGLLDGQTLVGVVGDTACNPQAAVDAATKAVNIEGVAGIVGPHCSGEVLAVAGSVTVPAGLVMISPAATSPEVSNLNDNDTVFRTTPSDDFQGRALARVLLDRGHKKVAVAYLNNDYGTGLANAFKAEFESKGGTIAGLAAHEGGKASYRSNLVELSRAGAKTLVVFDYGDGSGLTILRQALENKLFESFAGSETMKSDALLKELGGENLTNFVASAVVSEKSDAAERFNAAFKADGGNQDALYVGTSYDATFLLALALEKAGGDRAKVPGSLREVAAGKGGVPILPGEWAKAKALIAEGKSIDYKGAVGDHNFDAKGDVPGAYSLFRAGSNGFEEVTKLQ